jgi:hypothetical protein
MCFYYGRRTNFPQGSVMIQYHSLQLAGRKRPPFICFPQVVLGDRRSQINPCGKFEQRPGLYQCVFTMAEEQTSGKVEWYFGYIHFNLGEEKDHSSASRKLYLAIIIHKFTLAGSLNSAMDYSHTLSPQSKNKLPAR